jgi:alkaline phosphatase
MNRRNFLNVSLLAAAGSALVKPAFASEPLPHSSSSSPKKIAKNIIFLVSDGMSLGTLTMSDLFLRRKEGRGANWLNLYRERKATHALVDTASADSLVTDSAAGSSAWGCGVRVKNGSLCVAPDGSKPQTILQKFKQAGRGTGCVTTVTITHATPAGFAVNISNRGSEDDVATQYLERKFDVLMGGGAEFFSASSRKDKRDLFGEFSKAGYHVARTRSEMLASASAKSILGVFTKGALPYSLDRSADLALQTATPTLAEMTQTAIDALKTNPNGFILQVEGGKVDWGAHANDIGALLYDQIAFDEAIATALRFAESNGETLVIITSDHGNSNPGLIKSAKVDQGFDSLQRFKRTNEWVLFNTRKTDNPQKLIDRVKDAQGFVLKKEEAAELLAAYSNLSEEGVYNKYKLPFRRYAEIQKERTSVGWSGMDHSADYVELGMFGPGSEKLPPLIQNIALHNFMLDAAEIDRKA